MESAHILLVEFDSTRTYTTEQVISSIDAALQREEIGDIDYKATFVVSCDDSTKRVTVSCLPVSYMHLSVGETYVCIGAKALLTALMFSLLPE